MMIIIRLLEVLLGVCFAVSQSHTLPLQSSLGGVNAPLLCQSRSLEPALLCSALPSVVYLHCQRRVFFDQVCVCVFVFRSSSQEMSIPPSWRLVNLSFPLSLSLSPKMATCAEVCAVATSTAAADWRVAVSILRSGHCWSAVMMRQCVREALIARCLLAGRLPVCLAVHWWWCLTGGNDDALACTPFLTLSQPGH